ncbi:succinylglutamate desuccinylase/aspartoacylase domain-containing protein [Halocatena salina]|uniref:Succinylglutamate desuccinylase/aspartoacylase family protein n=1 Tax=Halocatena salina TaxID=2934340 RepID=A0A8U0A200_9EURY|nr:succinylglutamate desuccinylase/aspartoacylase family protein [Halocatena salina]UPM43094.1 succinylglutamate desuccinylase/aspartoacylase family protein [Halocatena salina]
MPKPRGRRSFLAAMTTVSASAAWIGQASAAENRSGKLANACSRRDMGDQTSPVPTGTSDITDILDVAITDSKNEGRTAFIAGGIHGDERAGITAAKNITEWTPDYGRLVVLPEANPEAIERNSRENSSGNLNRKFPVGSEPRSALARSIWDAVTAVDPDLLITLHESKGINSGTPAGVGQGVFHRGRPDTHNATQMGIRRANKTIGKKRLRFSHGRISGPNHPPTGLLSEKADYDAGISSFIIETYEGVNENTRVQWQKTITRGILDHYDIYE